MTSDYNIRWDRGYLWPDLSYCDLNKKPQRKSKFPQVSHLIGACLETGDPEQDSPFSSNVQGLLIVYTIAFVEALLLLAQNEELWIWSHLLGLNLCGVKSVRSFAHQ